MKKVVTHVLILILGALLLSGCQEGKKKELSETISLHSTAPDMIPSNPKSVQTKDTLSNPPETDHPLSTVSPTGVQEKPLYLDGENDWVIRYGKLLRSTDSGTRWEPVVVNKILASDQLLSGYFSDYLTGWAFYWRKDKSSSSIIVAHTEPDYSSEGKSKPWATEALPTEEDWETSPDVKVNSFFYEYRPGYVLLSSSPSAGHMMKTLYQSDDHGVKWKRVGNLTSVIKGDPTGISFRNKDVGWISCSVRGEERVQFYRTKDAGHTWTEQTLPFPEPFNSNGAYAETYPPVFDQENDHHGILFVEFVKNAIKDLVPYETQDDGETWVPKSPLPEKVKIPGINFLEMNAWALSVDGSTLYTTDDLNKGWQSIQSDHNLNQASGIYLRAGGSGRVFIGGQELWTSDGGRTWLSP